MTQSRLTDTLTRVAARSAASIIAHRKISDPGLNSVLLRRLSARPGHGDSFLAGPVFEAARAWEQSPDTFGDLSGSLLHADLVSSLDGATSERMAKDRHPYVHQVEAWNAAKEGLSCLVTSGTGSGKTECFMVPILDSLLRDPSKGRLSGIRAIIIYPLNALIESQRERLAAWTESLSNRVSFALYNGLTPETARKITKDPAKAELGDRKSIRQTPPSILITNVTMLEYLLLRSQDQSILEKSQGLLRWIVLDEAHGYIGSQAAEMALLLRRVRSAFGVSPEQTRLIATSATISEGEGTNDKLRDFVAKLAGTNEDRVRVLEGRSIEPELPLAGPDTAIDAASLESLSSGDLWATLAPHPRVQNLKRAMMAGGISLEVASASLFNDCTRQAETQSVLDAGARATAPDTNQRLLPWRAHVFHRAQGGIWACIDPVCPHRDEELTQENSNWGFGAVWLEQRDHCGCGAPVFEIRICSECGGVHLVAGREVGIEAELVPLLASGEDEFATDLEPDPDDDEDVRVRDRVWLAPARGGREDCYVDPKTGTLFENGAPEGQRTIPVRLLDSPVIRQCCTSASDGVLQPARYGPPFLMSNAFPLLLEQLASPHGPAGLPMGGRRAISFSDSRQGVARLAAKLQQDAERNLTRAFLYHSVQQDQGPSPEERADKEEKLRKMREIDPSMFADDIRGLEAELFGAPRPIAWDALITRFGQQSELREFATEVWAERDWGGREMAENPEKLAEMFFYRELFRRPRVQNSAETMGLLRLSFPAMDVASRSAVPEPLAEAGVTQDGWANLAHAAIDLVFRDNFAVNIEADRLARWVNPRRPGRRSVFASDTPREQVTEKNPVFWTRPHVTHGRPSRLLRLVYRLIGGSQDSKIDQDRAGQVLAALWHLITKYAAKDAGAGAWRVDFRKAAIERLDEGWLCPVTRRILAHNPGGASPFNPDDPRPLASVRFPRLPLSNPGGISASDRDALAAWCESDPDVSALRTRGIWTDLHDRIAAYAPFLRAQEHSAQIDRPVLQIYEELFKEGRINLLNCSTTMEMGVDIPNVTLVVNSNVPPSASNYRQRVGRAGRRGEPWAFGFTFCRNLPLDRAVFDDPKKILTAPIAAPVVRLDSTPIVNRHVHAALLAAFLRGQAENFNIKASAGAFYGATLESDQPIDPNNPANIFLATLQNVTFAQSQEKVLDELVRGSVRAGQTASRFCAETSEAFETFLRRWRAEYCQIIESAAAATDEEVRQAYEMRAKRMRGEFLLSDLARRGFTPSYGFPVDVVNFDHLSHSKRDPGEVGMVGFGERYGGASRTLDIAIREYAPGSEVVINGLVHQSEGIQPAWSAIADASGLEDLQFLWECASCRGFGLARSAPATCPHCGSEEPHWSRALRPAGFLGRKAPHTGYESLKMVPYEMPRLSAAGTSWQALPDPEAGRLRADPDGLVINRASGPDGKGYALCLACGRAEAEVEDGGPMPGTLKRHKPLAPIRSELMVKGFCPGGLTRPERIQRNLRLVQETRTDVFELQLPRGQTRGTGLSVAAGLREALAERLGAEAREIGLAVGTSIGPSGEQRVSA